MRRIMYARILLCIMVLQVLTSVPALALTGGPTQPEFQSFEPATTSEMVNLPDGGFTYNLPLMDVGGYPLNLSYHSDISADMEASCVGLGWSINPGVINRNVRALPDDFNGDEIVKEFSLKPNTTFGASIGASLELFGLDFLKDAKMNLGISMGVFYNNYWGIGYEFGVSPSVSAGSKGGGKLTAGLGLNVNSQSGANFSPNLGYSVKMQEADGKSNFGLGASLSTQINSREGLRATTLSANASRNIESDDKSVTDRSSAGTGSSATFDFAGNTYTPEFQMPQNNVSVSVNIKPVGVELFGTNVAFDISGYFSRQYLRNNLIKKQSYGLLYAHAGANNIHALMDFNREKDGAFHDYSISLPLVNPGYDVLSVTGQGIGGSFQLKRGDVPVFYDAQSIAEGNGGSLGLELGTGNTAHGGVDLKFNYSNSTSKKWSSGNQVLQKYNFRSPSSTTAAGYEPSYYKAAGEMAIESDSMYYKFIGKDQAVTANLIAGGSPFNVQTSHDLKYNSTNGVTMPAGSANVHRTKRERRNQVITYLTADEAHAVGINKYIQNYEYNNFTYPHTISDVPRNSGKRKGHHISQVESVQQDGMRYIYGIPAYNLVQKEVSFSVQNKIRNCNRGTVTYGAGDNSKGNSSGQEKYFSSVETPGFAHSYLLTTVLGKDYEDITGDGPSPDDFGSYTKINYTRIEVNNSEKYHWRAPFGRNEANYNAGYYSKDFDDKGTYIYGEKEIWLVHSIESKTMIAEFEYGTRFDGYGVIDENGGMAGANFNRKLESITLYSRPDRIRNPTTAVPIKIVHFDYDYSMCPGTDNSKVDPLNPSGGKLTLTRLYFTYGHSKKGAFSTYRFTYKQTGPSTNYSPKAFDRWGNFMPDVPNLTCWNPIPGSFLSNEEFPYAEQNKQTADDNAGMWSLESIHLPTGGEIEIDYEAKHYAYVQDKPAMKLFQIKNLGISNGNSATPTGSSLYSGSTNYNVVFIDLLPGTSVQEFKAKYLRNILLNDTYVYLKCFVKLNAGSPDKFEYVSMYAQITKYGVSGNQGWVELNPLPTTDKNNASTMLQPITKYALQFMRESLPDIAFGQTAITESTPQNLDLFKPLAEMGHQLAQLFVGFNREMINRGYCKEIALDRSFIRLCEPKGFKYGGGSMVKKIVMKDHWGSMTGVNQTVEYGQEYDYRTLETRQDGSRDTISSGVASYEPMIGGDENPMKMPVVITQQRKWAVDNVHYMEEPFGEVFMPSPQIVFSKITVKNLRHNNVKRTATGHSEMRYYTAKDFPVKTRRTDIQKMPKRMNPLLGLLKVKLKEHMNAAQGFLIELNDMHGKPMSSEVFDESGTKISGVYYHYKTKSPGDLDNTVDVIHANGKVTTGLLGINYSLAGDARESITQTKSGGVAFNLDGFIIGPIPVIVPLPWPQFEQSEEQFKSIAFTKVVNKFGILERTEAFDLGSTISTDNLAYDAETGEVLLTRTYNEFDDPIYNLKLPAHFAYEGMRGAYKNIGFVAGATSTAPVGTYQVTNADAEFFMPGDELLVTQGQISGKAWVLNKIGDKIFLIQIDGRPIPTTGAVTLKNIRSGYRNMPSIPIETFTSLHNPIDNTVSPRVINFMPPGAKPLQAEATEYSEDWQSFCCGVIVENQNGVFNTLNPYVHNIKGEWRPQRSWLYLTNRHKGSQAPLVNVSSTNIRDNGYFESFRSFWELPPAGLSLWSKNETNWTWSALSKQVNPNGTELESQNRLGLYSAEITGYYHQLITGVAANSRYRQIAFEGFEDFEYVWTFPDIRCRLPRHFGDGFENYLDRTAWHTGKFSVKVPANGSISTSYAIIENCPPQSNMIVETSRNPNPFKPYEINQCNCIQTFSPDTGRYVITAWVREGNGLCQPSFDKNELIVTTGSTIHPPFKASDMIIDGWQRIEGEFNISPGETNIEVKLKSLTTADVYFDDIRIFPFHASMKNYVYDDISLKLMAELDPNGYAKFYEYSPEGELIRIKQETELGIMTIQESRSSNPKPNPMLK